VDTIFKWSDEEIVPALEAVMRIVGIQMKASLNSIFFLGSSYCEISSCLSEFGQSQPSFLLRTLLRGETDDPYIKQLLEIGIDIFVFKNLFPSRCLPASRNNCIDQAAHQVRFVFPCGRKVDRLVEPLEHVIDVRSATDSLMRYVANICVHRTRTLGSQSLS
jgi:hypothetical protein